MTRAARRVAAGLLAGVAAAGALPAQARDSLPERPRELRIFLDCQTRSCDSTHIRNEVRFVNWMRDRTDSDVYVLVTSQSTGGGGERYRITLAGAGRS